jgi:hypothetical protein
MIVVFAIIAIIWRFSRPQLDGVWAPLDRRLCRDQGIDDMYLVIAGEQRQLTVCARIYDKDGAVVFDDMFCTIGQLSSHGRVNELYSDVFGERARLAIEKDRDSSDQTLIKLYVKRRRPAGDDDGADSDDDGDDREQLLGVFRRISS